MGSVVAKILQVLEDDVKYSQPDKFARQLSTNQSDGTRTTLGILLQAMSPRRWCGRGVDISY